MTAFLSTSSGRVVRVPHFLLSCRNCGALLRVNFKPRLETRTTFTLVLVCEGGCGIDEAFTIEPTPKSRGGT